MDDKGLDGLIFVPWEQECLLWISAAEKCVKYLLNVMCKVASLGLGLGVRIRQEAVDGGLLESDLGHRLVQRESSLSAFSSRNVGRNY